MIYTAILGHGVVGSGTTEILLAEKDRFAKRLGDELAVKYILDLRDFPDLPYAEKFTKDFKVIAADESIKIVAEMMGGVHPAYEFTKQCLQAGKSVVTSNKELVAAKGDELLALAAENNVNYLFEASVGGGIPILRPLSQCLLANNIQSIAGILNGTTNFILNKMIVENMDFADALKLAQEKGYAEKDPTADVEGHDAARKVCILASLAYGKHIYPESVATEGISSITLNDVEYADRLNCVIKLIGRVKRLADGHITASVRPTLIPRDHILAGVNGVFNAVLVDGDKTGEVLFYGKGAGKFPTASAVVADILDCAEHLEKRKNIAWQPAEPGFAVPSDEAAPLYVYAKARDYDTFIRQVQALFPDGTILKNEAACECAFLTPAERESVLREKLAALPAAELKILHTL